MLRISIPNEELFEISSMVNLLQYLVYYSVLSNKEKKLQLSKKMMSLSFKFYLVEKIYLLAMHKEDDIVDSLSKLCQ